MDALQLHDPAPLAAPARLDQAPALVYVSRLAPGSRRTMAQALNTIADLLRPGSNAGMFPWHRLDYQHTQAIRAQLADRYAPNTANKMLAALRGCLKEAWRLGLMSAEQYQRARDVQTIRGTRLPKGRALASAELSALLNSCGDDVAGLRDGALIACLYSGAFRRSEAVSLDVRDYRAADASVTIRSGKGNKSRIVYLADFARERLDRWLAVRDAQSGPIFVRIRRHGHVTPDRLTDQAVRYILHKRCELAGVEPTAPHDFRRTAASDLLEAGVDVGTVQNILGHANVATTLLYDRRPHDRMKRAAQRLKVL